MFSITGAAVPCTIVIAWVVLTGGLMFFWRRLESRGVWTVTGRIAGLLAANILVVLLAFVLLNDQYEFYASWSELAAGLSSGGLLSP